MSDVERVHQAIAGLGVVGLLAALGLKSRRNGSRHRIACPVHRGTQPNCVVEAKDGAIVFVCHSGCGGAGGDALALIAAVRGLEVKTEFGAVLREAAAIGGITLDGPRAASPYGREPRRFEAPPIDPAVAAHQRELAEGRERVLSTLLDLCPLEGEGLAYLTDERALSPEVCRSFRVGYVSDPASVRRVLLRGFSAEVLDELGIVYRGELLAFARHPVIVPIIQRGRPTYVQGRALGAVASKHERWRSMRGSVPGLWNHDALADRHKPVLIAEGPIDGRSAHQWAGTKFAVVAVFGAGGLKPEWCVPMRGREVLLGFDPDAAGDRGATRAAGVLNKLGCDVRRLGLPRGMDINDWMRAETAA